MRHADLEPCPFCGGGAAVGQVNLDPLWFSVICLGNGDTPPCYASNKGETEEEAIAAWNRRSKLVNSQK